MRNEQEWEETLVNYHNGEFTINEEYIGDRSLLVAHEVLGIYQKLIQKHAKGVLLDLGCGTVPYYKIYKEQVDEIICIDWANSLHENIHLDHIADLNKKVPVDTDCIDTVLLTDVLEHISKPYILMAEISRVLKNEGRLILGVPFMYWLHEDPFDYHRYTKYQLIELCENNSLNILSIQEVGGPLTVISDIIAKNLPFYLAPKIFQKVMIRFISSKFGAKLDNRNKEKFPRSYCLVAEKI